jgi:hypothetical protein
LNMFFVSAVRNIILQKSRQTFPFQEYEERPQPITSQPFRHLQFVCVLAVAPLLAQPQARALPIHAKIGREWGPCTLSPCLCVSM